MGKFLINIHDGTVCDLAGTVIVNTETLDEAGKALLHEWNEGGNDSTACEIGEKYGVELDRYTDNDLTYANSIAYQVHWEYGEKNFTCAIASISGCFSLLYRGFSVPLISCVKSRCLRFALWVSIT